MGFLYLKILVVNPELIQLKKGFLLGLQIGGGLINPINKLMKSTSGSKNNFLCSWEQEIRGATVEPCYNEMSQYRKNVRCSGVFVIVETPL